MRLTRLVDRPSRGNERLREHLSTEHPSGPDVSIAPAVDVDLERFEIEKVQEVGESYGHFGRDWRLAAGDEVPGAGDGQRPG